MGNMGMITFDKDNRCLNVDTTIFLTENLLNDLEELKLYVGCWVLGQLIGITPSDFLHREKYPSIIAKLKELFESKEKYIS